MKINKYIQLYIRFLKENNIKYSSQLYARIHELKPSPREFAYTMHTSLNDSNKWLLFLNSNISYRQHIEHLFFTFLENRGLQETFLFNFNSIEGKAWRMCYNYGTNLTDFIGKLHNPMYIIRQAFAWGETKFTQKDEKTKEVIVKRNVKLWHEINTDFYMFVRNQMYK